MDNAEWKNIVSRVKRVSIETYQAGKVRSVCLLCVSPRRSARSGYAG